MIPLKNDENQQIEIDNDSLEKKLSLMNNKDGLNIELLKEKILSIARGIDGICGLKKSKGESILVH